MERGGVPALENAGSDRGNALLLYSSDAVVPGGCGAQLGSSIAENRALQAICCINAKPLPYHSTQRQTAEMHLLQAETIKQCQSIVGKQFDRIGSRRNRRCAVATAVVAKNGKALTQGIHLRQPHGEVSAQGMGEYQYFGVRPFFEFVVEAKVLQV